MATTEQEIRAAVHGTPIGWRHPIEIRGVPVPADAHHAAHTRWMLECMRLPASMAGETVLDIGCSDGFFAFEAERRGAARVVGIDSWWGAGPVKAKPAGFDSDDDEQRRTVTSSNFFTAHRLLDSKVEFYEVDIQRVEATPQLRDARFTTIFFLGVYYHLENVLGGLRGVRRLSEGRVLVEGEVERGSELPVMEFLGRPHDIQWKPTVPCLVKMLERCGFTSVRRLGDRASRVLLEAKP
jgi:tRNA (mo5U34)-methyltransferase